MTFFFPKVFISFPSGPTSEMTSYSSFHSPYVDWIAHPEAPTTTRTMCPEDLWKTDIVMSSGVFCFLGVFSAFKNVISSVDTCLSSGGVSFDDGELFWMSFFEDSWGGC